MVEYIEFFLKCARAGRSGVCGMGWPDAGLVLSLGPGGCWGRISPAVWKGCMGSRLLPKTEGATCKISPFLAIGISMKSMSGVLDLYFSRQRNVIERIMNFLGIRSFETCPVAFIMSNTSDVSWSLRSPRLLRWLQDNSKCGWQILKPKR